MARAKSDGGVTSWDMVKNAMEELGKKAKPQALQDHIQTKHNKLLSKSLISNYKSTMKKKRVFGKKRGRPPGAAVGAKGIQMNDLAAVRGLVGRLGATQVRQLVDVLA